MTSFPDGDFWPGTVAEALLCPHLAGVVFVAGVDVCYAAQGYFELQEAF